MENDVEPTDDQSGLDFAKHKNEILRNGSAR